MSKIKNRIDFWLSFLNTHTNMDNLRKSFSIILIANKVDRCEDKNHVNDFKEMVNNYFLQRKISSLVLTCGKNFYFILKKLIFSIG